MQDVDALYLGACIGVDMVVSMARGYAYAKIEYVCVRTYLSKNRIREWYVSYASIHLHLYTQNVSSISTLKCCRVVKQLPGSMQLLWQFWKLFTFFAAVLIILFCCSCNVLFLRTLTYNRLR